MTTCLGKSYSVGLPCARFVNYLLLSGVGAEKLSILGRPTDLVLLIWITVGQGPVALAVGASGGCLDIFTLVYLFSFLSPSLWETARYRLKYCLKGPLSPNQPTILLIWKIARQ